METKSIVFFDGVCNLCNKSVQTIIKYDKNNQFLFAPLQGETASHLLSDFKSNNPDIDSIILFQNKRILIKSTAALAIAKKLSFPLNITYAFVILPVFIRDRIYIWIAKNRYHWFGKKEECWLPAPEFKSKFLP